MTEDQTSSGSPGASIEDAARTAQNRIEDSLQDAHALVKRQWSERPLTVAAVAVGVGALIGLAMSKRR